MKAWLKSGRPVVVAMAVAIAFGACDEQLDGGLACPALCPQAETSVRDTTFFAVDLDTTIAGFPAMGSEADLFIANLGDTLETRGVVRFDSLPSTFRHTNSATDSTIFEIDTAQIKLSIVNPDTTGLSAMPPTTVEIYDVDLAGPDNDDPTAVKDFYTPDRLLGSRTFAAESLKDSLTVQLDTGKVMERIRAAVPDNRMRLGIKITSTGSTRLNVITSNNSTGSPELRIRQTGDSTIPMVRVFPRSNFPAEVFAATALRDYLVVIKAPPEPPFDVLRVGGIFGRRAYLRFRIPSYILDSSDVVRASLILTQRPNPDAPDATDTVAIQRLGVVAAPAVSDLARALLLLSPITRAGVSDSLRLVPKDSGQRSFEIVTLVRSWRATDTLKTPRALALRTTTEGGDARQADFFSLEAPIGVRPHLHLTYVRRRQEGLP